MPTPPLKRALPISIPVSLFPAFGIFFCQPTTVAVLGIGERVGITPLGGLVACLYAANPEYVKSKYNLPMLREIENLVAEAVEVNIPFMNPITCVLFSPIPTPQTELVALVQRILRVHTQGWYSRQSYPQQPQHL